MPVKKCPFSPIDGSFPQARRRCRGKCTTGKPARKRSAEVPYFHNTGSEADEVQGCLTFADGKPPYNKEQAVL